MLIAVPALAQPSFDYDRLVDAYATGNLNEAVSQLSRWPSEQVKGAVGLFVKATEAQTALVTAPVSSRRLRAAVMLHTDLAAALLNGDFGRAESHSTWHGGSWTSWRAAAGGILARANSSRVGTSSRPASTWRTQAPIKRCCWSRKGSLTRRTMRRCICTAASSSR